MKKDFAAKAKNRGNATRFDDNKPDNNVLITMILGLVLGVGLTLAAIYYYNQSPAEDTTTTPEVTPEKPSAKNRYKAVPADEIERPDFSFHDELQNKTLEINPEPEEIVDSDITFIMQCGAFKQRAMAENRKATIGLNGFPARIKVSVSEQGTTWHRVVLGPYKSKRQANKERRQLERNNINGCRIW